MKYWYDKNKQMVNEYKYLIMLDLNSSELDRLSKEDDFVEKFNEKITELNEQETFQSAMTYEEDQRLILNTEKSISFDEGFEQGSKESKIEISKSMTAKKMDINLISELTGLSVDEIKYLYYN